MDAFFNPLIDRLDRIADTFEEISTAYQREKIAAERRARAAEAKELREAEEKKRAEAEAAKRETTAERKHDEADEIALRAAQAESKAKAVWRKAYDAALATLKGDVKTLRERRDGVIKAFAAFGVKPEQLFAALSIGGMDDITLETMPVLIGMHNALKSGEATVEEMFGGAAAAGGGERKNLRGKLEDVASGGKAKEVDKPKSEKPKEEAEGKADKAAEQERESKSADDDFPGDTPAPSNDEIEAAKDRGGEAYHRGMSSKAIPQEYRGVPALADAWLGAYATAAAEDKGGEA
ncbi:hypothetical protein [Shinella sp. HZN7]|uniref:hypothetical protein n=1 Tax=Shinella sp. (strain HZN7) TaxID=879274 RepID=UPI0007DA8FA2|nr:hypothetical protein [Shinella sp. HZN7]ANH05174.1 hypothetical protein shn_14805 [Shinella sp. HZN7]